MGEGAGLGVSPNYLWWQRVGAAWPDEVKRRKRHRLLYHVEEVFLAEYFALWRGDWGREVHTAGPHRANTRRLGRRACSRGPAACPVTVSERAVRRRLHGERAHPQPPRAPRARAPGAGACLPRAPAPHLERTRQRDGALVGRARRLLAPSAAASLRPDGSHLRAAPVLLRRAWRLPRPRRSGRPRRRPPPHDPRKSSPDAGGDGGVLRDLRDSRGGAPRGDDRRPRSPVGGGPAPVPGLRGGAGEPREPARAAVGHAVRVSPRRTSSWRPSVGRARARRTLSPIASGG